MSSDFRAPERLFALLMQAAGRAGRDAAFVGQQGSQPQMWMQTQQPEHPLVPSPAARTTTPALPQQQLNERQQAGMPPFAYQALVRADAKTQEAAQSFLQAAAQHAQSLPALAGVFLYPPIPMAVQRVANIERAQMLIAGRQPQRLAKIFARLATRAAPPPKTAQNRGALAGGCGPAECVGSGFALLAPRAQTKFSGRSPLRTQAGLGVMLASA